MEMPRATISTDGYIRFGLYLTALCRRHHITHSRLQHLTHLKNGTITAIKKGNRQTWTIITASSLPSIPSFPMRKPVPSTRPPATSSSTPHNKTFWVQDTLFLLAEWCVCKKKIRWSWNQKACFQWFLIQRNFKAHSAKHSESVFPVFVNL